MITAKMLRFVFASLLLVATINGSANNPVAFAQHAEFTSVTISPKGEYLAVGILHEGKRAAAILDFDTKKLLTLVSFRNKL